MTENTTKNKGGRPQIKLDALQIRDIELLAAYLTIKGIANYLGISEKSFRNIKKRDEAVFTAYNRGVAKAHAHAGNIIMKFMRYDGDDIAQLQLQFQAAKFYVQTKAGWGKEEKAFKINVPEEATPLEIINILTSRLSNDGLTPTEFKQLTDLVQLKQQVLSLQPKDEQAAPSHTLEECIEIADKLLPASNILELELENRRLKKQLAEAGNA